MIASQPSNLGLGVRPFVPPVLDGMPMDHMPLDDLGQNNLGQDDGPQASRLLASAARPAATPAKAEPASQAKPVRQAEPAPQAGPARRDATPRAPQHRPSRQAQAGAGQSAHRRRPLSRFLENDDNPGFYLSLSDLMCLLLVFFVLIFSLKEPSPETAPAQAAAAAPAAPAKQVVKAAIPLRPLRPLADPFPHPEPVPANLRLSMVSVASAGQSDPGLVAEPPLGREDGSGQNFDRALFTLVGSGAPLPASALPDGEPSLESMISQVKGQTQGLEVESNGERVLLRLPESITFDLARADIKPGMSQTLNHLAAILARHPEVPVVVTGHTDDLPINTPAYASNWELSSARAAAVGRALSAQGLEQSRLTIRGLADRQPRLPNTSEANRGQNRRVEIELRLNS